MRWVFTLNNDATNFNKGSHKYATVHTCLQFHIVWPKWVEEWGHPKKGKCSQKMGAFSPKLGISVLRAGACAPFFST